MDGVYIEHPHPLASVVAEWKSYRCVSMCLARTLAPRGVTRHAGIRRDHNWHLCTSFQLFCVAYWLFMSSPSSVDTT